MDPIDSPQLSGQISRLMKNICFFCFMGSKLRLRFYQQYPIMAIVDSVIKEKGYTFVVMFPRQSGKNELQAQIEAYLLLYYSASNAELVKVSPTWKPQSLNAMRRLERTLEGNLLTHDHWTKDEGFIFRINTARIYFFSGQPEANIVGATASTLLEVDEAQDVDISKFDKDIAPMAASTNATRVFWGTAWTSRTLLARELRAATEAQRRDGVQRVFKITADAVAAEVPAYGQFVAQQIAKLGRNNPMVKTQFFSEEIDAEGRLFSPERIALMQGSHSGQTSPTSGKLYAVLIDVAGVDESSSSPLQGGDTEGGLSNPGRDSTALTIVEADTTTLQDPIIQAPTYKAVFRGLWTGISHARLYPIIKALCDLWNVKYIVIDATGVGAGISSFLVAAFGERVIPFVFTSASKSKLGWDFLAIIDSGRWKEPTPEEGEKIQEEFFHQLEFIEYEILPGPNKLIRWSVPDGTRDPATGELVHDDLVLSAALVANLEAQPWTVTGAPMVIHASDPIQDLDKGF